MKKQLSLVKQFASVAIAGGMVCFASTASAQTAAPDPTIEPSRVGSMSAVGQKPRKADAQKTDTTASSSPSAAGTQEGAGQMSAADRQFMMMAAKDGMKEVQMGQMAAKEGQSAEVKKMGSQIAADHTKANQQLMAIATKKGIKLPTDQKMDKMSKKDMANFDQAWLGMMINDHQKDIAVYQRQAQQGTDPELKAFAKKTTPVLQKHLKMVQAAQKKMGSGATAPDDSAATTKTGR